MVSVGHPRQQGDFELCLFLLFVAALLQDHPVLVVHRVVAAQLAGAPWPKLWQLDLTHELVAPEPGM